MRAPPRPLLLAAALAAALATGGANAQNDGHAALAPKDSADEQLVRTLDAIQKKRAELDQLMAKLGTLSQETAPTLPAGAETTVAVRGWARGPVIGVLLGEDARNGVRVMGITPESSAAAAGLRAGDRLVAIGGREILGTTAALKVANARRLLGELEAGKPVRLTYLRSGKRLNASVTPRIDQRVFVWNPGDNTLARMMGSEGAVQAHRGNHPSGSTVMPPGIQAAVKREIARLRTCPDGGCKAPLLAETFRWNGLNLATVDAQLGRYFGTDRGVLVLSTGRALPGLQPGDVLRKVDGKPVASPREAMAVLEARPAGSSVSVEYLRDRKIATTRVTVPKAMPLRFPAPPPPPPAPAAPPAPPSPAAPPAPRPPQAFEAAPEAAVVALVARAPTPPGPPAPPAPLSAQID